MIKCLATQKTHHIFMLQLLIINKNKKNQGYEQRNSNF
jgi:hypothetical protein